MQNGQLLPNTTNIIYGFPASPQPRGLFFHTFLFIFYHPFVPYILHSNAKLLTNFTLIYSVH
jgi:hypothetical protein